LTKIILHVVALGQKMKILIEGKITEKNFHKGTNAFLYLYKIFSSHTDAEFVNLKKRILGRSPISAHSYSRSLT